MKARADLLPWFQRLILAWASTQLCGLLGLEALLPVREGSTRGTG